MSPTTTEVKLEEELDEQSHLLENVRNKIAVLQKQLRRLNSELVEHKLLYDNKAEELRRFRLMYPDICKPPTR